MPCLGGIGGLANVILGQPVAFVYKHVAYPFKTGTNVRKLSTSADTLNAQGEDVANQIDNARRNGREPTQAAEEWLRRVDSLRSANDKIRIGYTQRCRIFGCCFPNCWANYKISKKALEKLPEVERCLNDQPINLTVDPNLQSIIDIPMPSIELMPSQEHFLAYALQFVKDKPEGMIGLWGTEGIGKTCILEKINNSFLGKTTFDTVIFLTASRDCSVLKIQTEIMERLKLIKDDNVTSQAKKIMSFLKDRSFLVLVDDLWEEIDLLKIGIPSHLGIRGQVTQKVIITSRFQKVCDLMNVLNPIEVPCFGESEARKLFKENVALENLYSRARIGPLAEELVRELKGIPSELKRVGKAMCRKEDPKRWEDTIHALKGLVLHKADDQLSLAGEKLKDLQGKKENLREKRNDVRYQIKIVGRNGKIVRPEVTRWLRRADDIISRVGRLSDQYSLNNSDVIVRIPEMLREVEACITDQPSNIDQEAVPPSVQLQEIRGPSLFTRDRNLQDALRLIKEDQVERIGIWGRGGVGKTHLLKAINNSFSDDPFFEVVIFVTASIESSVNQIQAEIVKDQKLKKGEDTVSQAHVIREFLEERNFLLLLDGLWDKIDLHAVGIPHPVGLGTTSEIKRTVVLTTRLQDVCNSMEARKQIKLSCLPEEEAWQLFQELVGQETLSHHHDIEARAKEIVMEIKGLPLGLVDIGSELCGKNDPGYWGSVSKHMQQSCRDENGPKFLHGIFKKLMHSYEKLRNQTLRDCFLTCSLWPEGQEIMKDELAHCWMGLGLVGKLDKAYGLISELEDASLLDGNDMGISVKMHDLFRDMALQISRDKWVVHTGNENSGPVRNSGFFQELFKIFAPELLRAPIPLNGNLARNFPWSNAEYVSLMRNHVGDLPLFDSDNYLQNLKTLCLQHNLLDERTVRIIQKFTMLKYLDLSWNRLKKIPEEICASSILEYLNLSHNTEICEVPDSFRKLIKLRFLFLGGTSIQTIPTGVISSLTKLQVLDTWSSYVPGMPSAVNCVLSVYPELECLNDLREVNIIVATVPGYELLTRCHNLPLGKVTLRSLDGKHELFHLSGGIFEDNLVGNTLSHLEIVQSNMVSINIEKEEKQQDYPFEALEVLKLVSLEELKGIIWHKMRPQDTFPRLHFLEVTFCDKLKHVSCVMYLPCLRKLYLNYCGSIRTAFQINKNRETTPTFPCLEVLRFAYLEGLVQICSSDVTFPSLKSLTLMGCEMLESLPFKMDTLPLNLKEIVFDKNLHWKKLEWEEEGVESFLEPYVKIEELPDAEDVTTALKYVLPFFPSKSRHRRGHYPGYHMNKHTNAADVLSSSSEPKHADVPSSSMEHPFTFSASSAQPRSSTYNLGSTSGHRGVVPYRRSG